MSVPRLPDPAKLVVGVVLRESDDVSAIAGPLAEAFGPPDLVSPWLPFDYTDYYKAEMGGPLRRRMFAFRELAAHDGLPEIKQATNALEDRFSRNGNRRFNLDPGFVTRERLVLATGKNFVHRIYLGRGIFADLTLIYKEGDFRPLPWTFPDYADDPLRTFLRQVRNRYMAQLRARHAIDPENDPNPNPIPNPETLRA
jgi:hypothetical protein